ncbi:uncharacterized protein LOC105834892 [Monomorium pharaonis]|uniref:uncharacterized protein LOC105834892 n=1 Tax=Monomorium pharaonis TaxID=307658 RepID=UPI0017466F98|nr:uncharacterized protein LOC105834892 [Monomorium pharaonis]
MPKLATFSAVWILTLLFRLVVTKNKTYPEQNVYILDSGEDRLAQDPSRSFWKQRPFRENESIETVRSESRNNILRLRTAGDTDLEEKYINASVNFDGKTLTDYNGPVIMEDHDDTGDRNLTGHIRVKRSEPIVRRRLTRSMIDSLLNSRDNINGKDGILGNSTFEESRVDRENRSATVSHSRRKRGVLPKDGHRRRRVKGNVGHTRHRAEAKNKNKKYNALKSSQRHVAKKTSNPSAKKKGKNTQKIAARTIDESQAESRIEKRESKNSGLNTNTINIGETGASIGQEENTPLINDRNLAEQRKENTLMLPFVHAGRAELRVRIEKIPTTESSFINPNHWTDRSVETSPCSIILPKFNMSGEIPDVTNLEIVPNFDSDGRKKANNLTVEITLKKLDDENNACDQEPSDSKDRPASFYNMESHSVGSNVPKIEDDRNPENENYDRTNEISGGSSDEDAKWRAKRNQEIMSKCNLRSDKNAKESGYLKHVEQGTLNGDAKSEKTRYRRTVRSIEEIKDLAEKLIIKISELQVYVSNRNETLHARDPCFGKNADRVIVREDPTISLKKKDASMATKVAENANNRERFAKNALASKRASQMRSSGSRFARGDYRTRGSRRKWGRWMDWSSCSVTCGKGRQIRWRHCLHDCNDAETEMEEKACQLPACPPSKFLGIF